MNKTARIISNIIYGVGAAITACLSCVALFGSRQVINPDAMIPITIREQAFLALAAGSIPMLIACIAVYRLNGVKSTTHAKRNTVLILLPGLICGGCALFCIGVLFVGYSRMFFNLY